MKKTQKLHKIEKIIFLFFLFFFINMLFLKSANAENVIPNVSLNLTTDGKNVNMADSVKILLLFTILSILPSILIMMTAFTRIIIILSMLKQALGAQRGIPQQSIVGLALFITFFVMAPVGQDAYNNGLKPYFEKKINEQTAIVETMKPVRKFMLKQTRESDIKLFLEISKDENLRKDNVKIENIPYSVLIPSFIISELKTGFQVGFLLFIPFIVIDMVVSSTLMSMGMMMLPPMMISMPFKLLLFIVVDGWDLIIRSIVVGFK